jgi:hypothetical protein
VRRGLIVLALCALLPASASGARRVAFVGFAAEGVPDDVRAQFETLIEEAVRKLGVLLVTRHDALEVVTQRELPEGCAFGPCVAAVSGALGVDRILDARIAAVGQSYSFVLTMVEGRRGTPVAQVVGTCAVCTVAEALGKVGAAVEVLEGKAVAGGASSDLVSHNPRRRSKAAPVALTVAGVAAVGGGALVVSQTERDGLGWAAVGAGGTMALTGIIWLMSRD